MFNILKIISLCLLVSMITGCKSRLPEDKEIFEYADSITAGEQYTFLDKKVNNTNKNNEPVDITYRFKTDRGFEFEITSKIISHTLDGAKIGEGPLVKSNYIEQVHSLYSDRINEILPENQLEYNIKYEINEIELTDKILKVDKIYQEELKYHSQDWLDSNPIRRIFFKYFPDYSDKYSGDFDVTEITITGNNNREDIIKIINNAKNMEEKQRQIALNTVKE